MTGLTPVIATKDGPVRGRVRDGIHEYLGIPYAAPPLGNLRWRPPEPAVAWSRPHEATEHGNRCAQNSSGIGLGAGGGTEDCLYLNVFTRSRQSADPAPVMVWIHGGGLCTGEAASYDPSALVRDGGVVVVSLNYRLNVLGFFSHPAINREGHPAGNYGIMDQQAALRWINDNIAAFGGDPHRVTVFGESAGGVSTLAHLVSPGSSGLMHRAITQSPGAAAATLTDDLADREHVGVDLARALGLRDQTPEKLRTLPTSDLMAADVPPPGEAGLGRFFIGLTVDGIVVPGPLRTLFTSGRFRRVPVINGVNRDEYTPFQAAAEIGTGRVLMAADYETALEKALTGQTENGMLFASPVPRHHLPEIVRRYPVDQYPSPSRALSAAAGDHGLIGAGGHRTNSMIGRFVDLYAYEWDVPDSPVAWPEVSFSYGSGHMQELQYLFPQFHGTGGTARALDANQERLATRMVHYWTTFAHSGTPNAPEADAPRWEPYDTEADHVMALRMPEPSMITDFSARHQCDFWDRVDSEGIQTQRVEPHHDGSY